ncbi:NUDIX domain-containing protein [Paenibacillus sp.]|uniref:NUDIX hydrolase n=1 Tax=Paenibacillus sp. TaxID=58172 RepID=UPI002810DF34|nr:NUDIX domain-containing protein [Paenibacillus sp.]
MMLSILVLSSESREKVVTSLIAEAIIVPNDSVLMVKQYVQRGDIVWKFPGGGIEEGESPEQAWERTER